MSRKVLFFAIITLALLSLFLWGEVLSQEKDVLEVHFLDVGQGDAIFIESPSGIQMLVDGGPHKSVLRPLGKEMSFFDRSIDIVAWTHPDADHIGGLPDILERYKISYLLKSQNESETALHGALERRISVEEAKEVEVRRGQVIDLGEGVFVEVLFPDRDIGSGDANLSSAVLRVVYGKTEFLLTGDTPKPIEEYLVSIDGNELHSDVLKLSHHGSKTSSSAIFLSAVSPDYAVVSAGCDNRYGHPHKEVLDRVLAQGIQVLETCKNGTVTFTSDGEDLTLER